VGIWGNFEVRGGGSFKTSEVFREAGNSLKRGLVVMEGQWGPRQASHGRK